MSHVALVRFAAFASLLFSLFWLGCSSNSTGDDDEQVTDGIAPSIVTDLSISSFTATTVTLAWTAVGDDTTSGTASSWSTSNAYISATTSGATDPRLRSLISSRRCS